MVAYFAIVKYISDNARRIVLSTDIKDFKPKHSGDLNVERIYQIQWQESQSKSFDGYFDGNVLLLAGMFFSSFTPLLVKMWYSKFLFVSWLRG
jgi:hypothetical protein